jgi:hypothetical protein
MSRLAVIVLGNRNSGKTTTWNELFGQIVRTGIHPRELEVATGLCVTVFLVSGSAQERRTDVETIMRSQTPDIVLCSVQYVAGAQDTFQYFLDNDYELVVHWLNPGYSDAGHQPDALGIFEWLKHQWSLLGMRDGKLVPARRVAELRAIIHGWAAQRGLVHQCGGGAV